MTSGLRVVAIEPRTQESAADLDLLSKEPSGAASRVCWADWHLQFVIAFRSIAGRLDPGFIAHFPAGIATAQILALAVLASGTGTRIAPYQHGAIAGTAAFAGLGLTAKRQGLLRGRLRLLALRRGWFWQG